MEGVTNWALFQQVRILDIDKGIIFSRSTTNILGITSIQYHETLNNGPYVDVSLIDSQFEIRTNDKYTEYEEYETISSMLVVTVNFSCNGGSTQRLAIYITVQDTNNNDPNFQIAEKNV
ncbi:hypothetical protein ACJJTC_015721 [Scirpophaga incertulas]